MHSYWYYLDDVMLDSTLAIEKNDICKTFSKNVQYIASWENNKKEEISMMISKCIWSLKKKMKYDLEWKTWQQNGNSNKPRLQCKKKNTSKTSLYLATFRRWCQFIYIFIFLDVILLIITFFRFGIPMFRKQTFCAR